MSSPRTARRDVAADRTERARVSVRSALDATWDAIGPSVVDAKQELVTEVSVRLEVPMRAADLEAVLVQVLTGAAGPGGEIRATGTERRGGGVTLLFQCTGSVPDRARFERTFAAARALLAEVGATIDLARPRKGYASAVEIRFPK